MLSHHSGYLLPEVVEPRFYGNGIEANASRSVGLVSGCSPDGHKAGLAQERDDAEAPATTEHSSEFLPARGVAMLGGGVGAGAGYLLFRLNPDVSPRHPGDEDYSSLIRIAPIIGLYIGSMTGAMISADVYPHGDVLMTAGMLSVLAGV